VEGYHGLPPGSIEPGNLRKSLAKMAERGEVVCRVDEHRVKPCRLYWRP